jgi:hypothetical protein
MYISMIKNLSVKLAMTIIHVGCHIVVMQAGHGLFLVLFMPSVHAADTGYVAYYSGPINVQRNNEFFARVKDRKISRLRITSSGGEVEAGVALGRWIFENRVDVHVEDYCLSSCANYVFPAARYKTVKQGAIVAWHGNYHHLLQTGLWHDDVPVRMQRTNESREQATNHVFKQVKKLVAIEQDFFQYIGVDEYLCWIGKQDPYNAPNYYFMSATDMARFGIDNVTLPPGYQDTDLSRFSMDIVYIRLRDKH